MTKTDEKVKYINLQLIATIGFIIALVISFTLSLDKRESLLNNERLYSDKETQEIALMQVILVFIVSCLFLYITYNQYNISNKYHENDEDIYLIFGKESTGIPREILRDYLDDTYRLPMVKEARSLNLSNCAAIGAYELLRQQGFKGLSDREVIKGEDWILK